jgi:hypothetical protein
MKIYALLGLFLAWNAHAATVLDGKDSSGNPCALTVEKFEFDGGKTDWTSLRMSVKTNWQKAGNPAIELKMSETPYALYGFNKDNYDQVAVSFSAVSEPALDHAISFNFQTWDEERGLVQTYCRLNKK